MYKVCPIVLCVILCQSSWETIGAVPGSKILIIKSIGHSRGDGQPREGRRRLPVDLHARDHQGEEHLGV